MKVSPRVASQVVQCLGAIGVICIDGRGGFTEEGQRKTWVYSVPAVSSFTEAELQKNIARARRTHPHLFLLRPDQAKIRAREKAA